MLAEIFLVLSALLAVVSALVSRVYRQMPTHELRRRAGHGDRVAQVWQRAAQKRLHPELIVWLALGLFTGVAAVIASHSLPIAVAGAFDGGLILTVVVLITSQAKLYTKSDLLAFLARQQAASYNRVPPQALQQTLHALEFGDKTVASVMTPRRAVRFVAGDEPVGPILITELHDCGFSSFPVTGEDDNQIIGTLYLGDLVEFKKAGLVKNVMQPAVYYVNQDQKLEHVLSAFSKTKHHLFIVLDQAEAIVGLITIEDVLEQIIGHEIVDEFDAHEDRQTVAALEKKSPDI